MNRAISQRNALSIFITCIALLIAPQRSFAADGVEQERLWFGKIGVATVRPNDSSGGVSGPGIPPGSAVGVGNATQLAGSVGRYLTDHVVAELILSLPFEHDIAAKGSIAGLGKIGTTKQLPPTIVMQYHFMQPTDRFRPYVGIGVNYTKFFSENASSALDAALGGATKLRLKASTGLAVDAGFDLDLSRDLFLNVGIVRIKIDTTATIDTAAAGTRRTVDVTIDPWIGMVALGYRF